MLEQARNARSVTRNKRSRNRGKMRAGQLVGKLSEGPPNEAEETDGELSN